MPQWAKCLLYKYDDMNSDSEHTCRGLVRRQTPVRTELGEEQRQQYLRALLASQLSQMASSWLNEKLPQNLRWRVIKEDARNQLLASADVCICTADHTGIGNHIHRRTHYNTYKHNATGLPISPCHPHKGLSSDS